MQRILSNQIEMERVPHSDYIVFEKLVWANCTEVDDVHIRFINIHSTDRGTKRMVSLTKTQKEYVTVIIIQANLCICLNTQI